MAEVLLENLTVMYGKSVVAVERFSLHVANGAFDVLLGPSGCGKSTLLNAIAGLVEPASGRISIGGQVVFDRDHRINLPPNRRDIGMVYQSYALWPHMSVFANVAFPLKRKGLSKPQIRHRVEEVLEQVRCGPLADRYPNQLSGGQQQRISLARALAPEPRLMLMDEPLSNLDAELRRDLRDEIAQLHQRMGFTAVYVTHDQQEAFGLGTEIAVMRGGRAIQISGPEALYRAPETVDVARFLGANVTRAWVEAPANNGEQVVATSFGPLCGIKQSAVPVNLKVAVFPARVALERVTTGATATVAVARFLGDRYEYVVRSDAGEFLRAVSYGDATKLVGGDRVRVSVSPGSVHFFDDEEQAIRLEFSPSSTMEGAGVVGR